MTSRTTFDSNILIYAVHAGERRQVAALELLRLGARSRARLGLQVIGEFTHVVPRKVLMTRAEAVVQATRWLDMFPEPFAASETAVRTALAAVTAGRFAYWDAVLLASASEVGLDTVVSEDMHSGAVLGCARIVRAFEGNDVSGEARALFAA